MIEVELPDGSIAEFPDGTPTETIKSALQRRFGAPQQDPSMAGDIAASGASGFARGAADLLGLPGTIADALTGGGRALLRGGYELATGEAPSPEGGVVEQFFAGPSPEVEAQLLGGNVLSGDRLRSGLETVTGGASEYQPQTTAGEYAATVGEFLPGTIAFGGASPSNIARYGVLPAVASEGAGQLTEGTAIEPYARVAAALAAPAIPSIASRAITPIGVSAERRAMADTLRREGVMPTAGQETGSRGLRFRESELGGNRVASILEQQGEDFTSAAMKRVGASGRATPENITKVRDRLSQTVKDLSSRNTLALDRGVIDDVANTLREYNVALPADQQRIIGDMASDILDKFKAGNGAMSGTQYQKIRSRLSTRANNARGNNNDLADAYRGLRDALDAGMARSVQPGDKGAWEQFRREWGNLKTIERAATGAGEDAALGIISPARLRSAVSTGKNRGSYARGEGDFDELARAGEAILRPLPDSGTASRINARTLGGILAALGGGGGAAVGGPAGAMAGTLAGAAIPPLAGRALLSAPMQAWLANNVVAPASTQWSRYAPIINALSARDPRGVEGR